VQPILGQGPPDQALPLSHTLEVEHLHSRATLEVESLLRDIQGLLVRGIQVPLQVRDMEELNRDTLEVVQILVMEEPHPHSNSLVMEEPHPHISNSLDMEEPHPHSRVMEGAQQHNKDILELDLSKATLELPLLNIRAMVLPLNSSRWTLKLLSGSKLWTRTGVDRLMQRSCRVPWSTGT